MLWIVIIFGRIFIAYISKFINKKNILLVGSIGTKSLIKTLSKIQYGIIPDPVITINVKKYLSKGVRTMPTVFVDYSREIINF